MVVLIGQSKSKEITLIGHFDTADKAKEYVNKRTIADQTYIVCEPNQNEVLYLEGPIG